MNVRLVGSIVTVLDLETSEEYTFHLVEPPSEVAQPYVLHQEVDENVSTASPVGQALVGATVGECLRIKVPAGTIYYKIVAVQGNVTASKHHKPLEDRREEAHVELSKLQEQLKRQESQVERLKQEKVREQERLRKQAELKRFQEQERLRLQTEKERINLAKRRLQEAQRRAEQARMEQENLRQEEERKRQEPIWQAEAERQRQLREQEQARQSQIAALQKAEQERLQQAQALALEQAERERKRRVSAEFAERERLRASLKFFDRVKLDLQRRSIESTRNLTITLEEARGMCLALDRNRTTDILFDVKQEVLLKRCRTSKEVIERDDSKNAVGGAGTGGVTGGGIGFMVGGPLGAIVGAAIGSVFGGTIASRTNPILAQWNTLIREIEALSI